MSDTGYGDRFAGWAVVELMGHITLAGYVTEQEIGGSMLLRIDVPESETGPAFSKLVGTGAIYGITPVDEDTVRAIVAESSPRPFSAYELSRAFDRYYKRRLETEKPELEAEFRNRLAGPPPGPGIYSGLSSGGHFEDDEDLDEVEPDELEARREASDQGFRALLGAQGGWRGIGASMLAHYALPFGEGARTLCGIVARLTDVFADPGDNDQCATCRQQLSAFGPEGPPASLFAVEEAEHAEASDD